jgi:hypothetical protein
MIEKMIKKQTLGSIVGGINISRCSISFGLADPIIVFIAGLAYSPTTEKT